MKKAILNFVLASVLIFGLFACSSEETATADKPQSISSMDKEEFVKAYTNAYKAEKYTFRTDIGNDSSLLFMRKQ